MKLFFSVGNLPDSNVESPFYLNRRKRVNVILNFFRREFGTYSARSRYPRALTFDIAGRTRSIDELPQSFLIRRLADIADEGPLSLQEMQDGAMRRF